MRLRTAVKKERKKREARWRKKRAAERERILRNSVPRVLPGEICLADRKHCRVMVLGKLVSAPIFSKEDFIGIWLPNTVGSKGTLVYSIHEGEHNPLLNKMELFSIFVPTEFRGDGNGKKLLGRALEIARENKVSVIWTKTSMDDFVIPYRVMLHKHGFRPSGLPNRLNNVIFKKILQ